MLFIKSLARRSKSAFSQWLIFFALLLIACSLLATTPAYAKKKVKAKVSAKSKSKAKPATKASLRKLAVTVDSGNEQLPPPDVLMAGIYTDLAEGQLKQALAKADRLVQAYPNFHVGHLIRGDLLLIHSRPVTTIGETPNNGANGQKLNELRAEAMTRLKSMTLKPDPDLVPRAFMQLHADHKYALLVDTANSRIHVYQHKNGKITLLNHYYISHGKLGVHKLREGDQKTPVGVYRITSRIPRGKLPDFYGTGALPLNYPNEWDKLHGRGGSGIWLHGMPSTNFSRPPLASDGCVALNNPDMSKVLDMAEIGHTPVVISDYAELVNATIMNRDRKEANRMLENWRRDLENGDQQIFARNYSAKFKTGSDETTTAWLARQYSLNPAQDVTIRLRDLTLFRYPGEKNMIVATFTVETRNGKNASNMQKRQYWSKEGTKWRIVHETRP